MKVGDRVRVTTAHHLYGGQSGEIVYSVRGPQPEDPAHIVLLDSTEEWGFTAEELEEEA